MNDIFGPPISVYTRQQAIEDGVLVDLMQTDTGTGECYGDMVREAGFKFPVAMTATAFAAVVWPIDDPVADAWLESKCQDIKGRLWDVLWMLKMAVRHGGESLLFKLYVIRHDVKPRGRRLTTLKSVCGPGDNGEPVITVMLPSED